MNFGQMQDEVRRQLRVLETDFFSDQDIKDAINEGSDELADATEWYERQATMPLLAGRTYYDLTSILPDTFLSERHLQNTTTNKWLDQTSATELDTQTYVQWELTYGEPQRFLMRGNWWLGVFPRQTSDSSHLRLYYSGIPAPMVDDDDEPGIPVEFHMAYVEFALSDLHSQQRETAKAVKHWEEYIDYQNRFRTFVEGRQSIDRKVHL